MTHVRLFGPTAVIAGASELSGTALGGEGPRRLLELLAVARGSAVSPTDLASRAGRPVEVVREDLRSLRRALGDPTAVTGDDDGWRLDGRRATVDLVVVQRLLARAATTGPSTTLAMTLRALRSCRLPLLASEPDAPWAEHERAAHDRLLRDALVRAAGAAVSTREADLAADLQRLAESPPGSLSSFSVTASHARRTLIPWETGRPGPREWSAWSSSTTTAPSPTCSAAP